MKSLQKIMMAGVLILTELCHLQAGQQLSQQDTVALKLIGAMQESIKLNGQLQLQLTTPEVAEQANRLKAQFAGFLDEYLTQFGQVYEKQGGLMNVYRSIYHIASKDNQVLAITPGEYSLLLDVLEKVAQNSDWRSTVNIELSVSKNGLIAKKNLKLHEIISAIKQVPLPANYSMTNILAGAAAVAAIGAGAYIAYNLARNQNYQVFGYNPFAPSVTAPTNVVAGDVSKKIDLQNKIAGMNQDGISEKIQVNAPEVTPVITAVAPIAAQEEQVESAYQVDQADESMLSSHVEDPNVTGVEPEQVDGQILVDGQIEENQQRQVMQDQPALNDQNDQNKTSEQQQDGQGNVETDMQALANSAGNFQAGLSAGASGDSFDDVDGNSDEQSSVNNSSFWDKHKGKIVTAAVVGTAAVLEKKTGAGRKMMQNVQENRKVAAKLSEYGPSNSLEKGAARALVESGSTESLKVYLNRLKLENAMSHQKEIHTDIKKINSQIKILQKKRPKGSDGNEWNEWIQSGNVSKIADLNNNKKDFIRRLDLRNKEVLQYMPKE